MPDPGRPTVAFLVLIIFIAVLLAAFVGIVLSLTK